MNSRLYGTEGFAFGSLAFSIELRVLASPAVVGVASDSSQPNRRSWRESCTQGTQDGCLFFCSEPSRFAFSSHRRVLQRKAKSDSE